ncbi:hypothetical protein KFK09_025057 [Dendrobium nobile]|uniref:Uncharacterized protein n=1 Tax=Dendrobium nobile TaxID=94219 RepID=A0A8T3AFU1_DENNO|nr:hypothetical protein KFK09_025057 [Dendrobium nobile]
MRILDIANLSLDEPELEAMIFIEDDIEIQRQITEEANPIIPSIEWLKLHVLDNLYIYFYYTRYLNF